MVCATVLPVVNGQTVVQSPIVSWWRALIGNPRVQIVRSSRFLFEKEETWAVPPRPAHGPLGLLCLKTFVAFLWQIAPIVPVLPTHPVFKSFAVNKMPLECHLHTVEVVGSNPAAPTINNIKCSLRCSSSARPLPYVTGASRSNSAAAKRQNNIIVRRLSDRVDFVQLDDLDAAGLSR